MIHPDVRMKNVNQAHYERLMDAARRAKPNMSPHRLASKASMRSARSAGRETGCLAAREKSRFAAARSTISLRGVNHKPRPGRRASTSGTSTLSGPTTKRRSEPRSPIWPVTMQRRCGDFAAAGRSRISGAVG